MIIIRILLLIFFFVESISLLENESSIRIVDTSYSSNYCLPVNDIYYNLYILTGDISGNNRNISKFNSSCILIDDNNFSGENKFEKPEAIYVKNNEKDYILTITSTSLELYDIEQNKLNQTFSNNLFGYKSSLLKLYDNNYIYAYQEKINKDNY